MKTLFFSASFLFLLIEVCFKIAICFSRQLNFFERPVRKSLLSVTNFKYCIFAGFSLAYMPIKIITIFVDPT
jgi:hypothetical protein